ncbi:MAG: N-acetylglucosamine kinase [Winogradskyella sp.]|uniref:N-acetylglucosamine kinase n=1 Tax=Winogradskyella sp. TaxID=1883156 RepID=UPI0025EFC0F4|nr:N-acetylglucosamine kinase [Winogradskyella sp.]NRB83786.1 N-acetylglucosamine kinase [Winogradskyella sp.]
MLLIADSGSTKCDWILYKNENNDPIRIRTKGLNPAILSKKELKKVITDSIELTSYKDIVNSIHFFGAGCGTRKNQKKINNVLTSIFEKADTTTKEDIMAAVYATTNEPAVVCILGTGSNCCFYDGQAVQLKTPSLGYIVMDEGSGNYFGKELLKKYFYNKMPIELKFSFENQFNLNEKNVVKKLYQSSTPNKYLAEFARFLFENQDHPFIENILVDGMTVFIENHIMQYEEELKTVPLHFVGSIAYHGRKHLEIALNKRGLKGSNYIRRPIDNLVHHIKTQN